MVDAHAFIDLVISSVLNISIGLVLFIMRYYVRKAPSPEG